MTQKPLTRRAALMAATGLAVAAAAGAQVTEAEAAPQPLMLSALQSLRAARSALRRATPDKGGHRVKAISLIDAAINEVNRGMVFDNRH